MIIKNIDMNLIKTKIKILLSYSIIIWERDKVC